jgi:Flp pilus assembly protein TadD
MMKFILLASLLVFASCASSPVTENEANPVSSAAEAKVSDPDEAPVKRSDVSSEPYKDKAVVSIYSGLNEAIRLQNEDAIQKTASEILTQNPKDIKALNSLGMVYYKKGRFEAAYYLLNKALSIAPETSELRSNMGLVLLAKNERREAVKSFRKAIELNPQDGIAGANVGSIYVQEKDYNKALLALEIAVKNGLRDPKIMTNYAISLAATGKVNEASEIYDRILKDNPSHKEAMLNYSILMIEEMKKYREGLDLLNRLKFVGSSTESRPLIKQLENKAKAGLQ